MNGMDAQGAEAARLSESDLWYSINDGNPVVSTIPASKRDERELVEAQVDSVRRHVMDEVV